MDTLRTRSNRRGSTLVAWIRIFVFASAMFGVAHPTEATSFNIVFDSSTSSAPAGFFSGFGNGIQTYQTMYGDPIVINLRVG